MSTTPYVTSKGFIEAWEFPPTAGKDFSLAGVSAKWASGHPKQWGFETSSFRLKQKPKEEGEKRGTSKGFSSALSDDNKLLAVRTSDSILIYDVESKELRQELPGTGKLFFCPYLSRVTDGGDNFSNKKADIRDGRGGSPAYTLLAKAPLEPGQKASQGTDLILWDLDENGRLLDFDEEAVDPSALATEAINAILPTLLNNHEWSKAFVNASTLHSDFESALQRVAAQYAQRHNTVFKNAGTAGYGGCPFSADGKKLLYHTRNLSTQGGIRESRQFPQVVVWDLELSRELFRFQGHRDIIWYDFSPNGQYIASLSWGGTMSMYSGITGEFLWSTPDSGSESWTGAFSPDSEHIAWSSRSGNLVRIHSATTGALVATLPETQSFRDWCRCIVWHPDSRQLALCVDRQLYVWRPFVSPKDDHVLAHHYVMPHDGEWDSVSTIATVHWLDEGRKLAAYISDGTILVYDERSNSKELFRRPKEVSVSGWDEHIYYIPHEETDFYLCADGDGTVRYWRTSVPAHPSWWEKKSSLDREPSFDGAAGTMGSWSEPTREEVKPAETGSEENVEEGGWWEKYEKKKESKKSFPETGKYVKITMPKASRKEMEKEKDKEEWARKGADLWTAE